METTQENTKQQEQSTTVQFRKRLLSISEYAQRYGVSVSQVEKNCKLGVVQTRKYKGQTYVVDAPFSFEADSREPQSSDKKSFARKVSELAHKYVANSAKKTEATSTENDEPSVEIHDESQTEEEMVETLQTNFRETIDEGDVYTEKIGDVIDDTNLFGPIEPPELELFEITDEFSKISDVKPETKKFSEPAITVATDRYRVSKVFAKKAKTKLRKWQVTAIALVIFLSFALFSNLWLFVNTEEATRSFEYIQNKTYNNAAKSIQRAELLKRDLDNSNAEVERLQSELKNTKAELEKTRSELMRIKQKFVTTRRRSIESVDQLNEQIQELSKRFEELGKSSGKRP